MGLHGGGLDLHVDGLRVVLRLALDSLGVVVNPGSVVVEHTDLGVVVGHGSSLAHGGLRGSDAVSGHRSSNVEASGGADGLGGEVWVAKLLSWGNVLLLDLGSAVAELGTTSSTIAAVEGHLGLLVGHLGLLVGKLGSAVGNLRSLVAVSDVGNAAADVTSSGNGAEHGLGEAELGIGSVNIETRSRLADTVVDAGASELVRSNVSSLLGDVAGSVDGHGEAVVVGLLLNSTVAVGLFAVADGGLLAPSVDESGGGSEDSSLEHFF